MAITLDSAVSNTTAGSGHTSASATFTNTAGTIMLAWLMTESSTSGATATWNGVNMTLIDSVASNAPSIYVFLLNNPDTGSNSLAFSWTGGSRESFGFLSFTGAGFDITQSANKAAVSAGTSNFSTTLTLTSAEMLVGFAAYLGTTANLAVVTGTEQAEQSTSGSTSSSAATNTGTGSISATWSRGASFAAAYVGVKLTEPVNVTASPAVIDVTMSVQTVTITGSANVTADSVSMTMSVQAPTVSLPTPDFTNQTKTTATFTNVSKNTETFTNQSKNSGTWTNQSKS